MVRWDGRWFLFCCIGKVQHIICFRIFLRFGDSYVYFFYLFTYIHTVQYNIVIEVYDIGDNLYFYLIHPM